MDRYGKAVVLTCAGVQAPDEITYMITVPRSVVDHRRLRRSVAQKPRPSSSVAATAPPVLRPSALEARNKRIKLLALLASFGLDLSLDLIGLCCIIGMSIALIGLSGRILL